MHCHARDLCCIDGAFYIARHCKKGLHVLGKLLITKKSMNEVGKFSLLSKFTKNFPTNDFHFPTACEPACLKTKLNLEKHEQRFLISILHLFSVICLSSPFN